MMRILTLSLVIICQLNIVYSQPKTIDSIRPLKVGDKVPDIVLNEILNYNVSSAKLSDLYKNKLLILDLWSTWCSICIAEFPRMKSLQDHFGDKILIMPVGNDGEEKGAIQNFVSKRKGTSREMPLPTAIIVGQNTVLQQLFPHSGLPAEVWIDSNGIYRGITSNLYVTVENIEKMLMSNNYRIPLSMPQNRIKTTDRFLFDREDSTNVIIYGSLFTNYIDSLKMSGTPVIVKSDPNRIRVFGVNLNIIQYYKKGYANVLTKLGSNTQRKVILKDADIRYRDEFSVNLLKTDFQQFCAENLFCYELILPAGYDSRQVNKILIQDFDRYFGVNSYVEEQTINCYVLVRTNKNKLPKSLFSSGASEPYDNMLGFNFRGAEMENFIDHLNYVLDPLILDETGITTKIDLDLPIKKKNDINEINQLLMEKGLQLKEAKRKINVIVLKKK